TRTVTPTSPTRRSSDLYTTRWELLGSYQLPFEEKMLFSFSYTDHDQNSVYGDIPYLAQQRIGFGQLTWDKTFKNHDLLFGTALRSEEHTSELQSREKLV